MNPPGLPPSVSAALDGWLASLRKVSGSLDELNAARIALQVAINDATQAAGKPASLTIDIGQQGT